MSSLRNKTIAITRSPQEAHEFFHLIEAEGGSAVAIPAIEIIPASSKVAHHLIASLKKKNYNYCAFMSAQAVTVFFDLVEDAAIALSKTSVIAVGPRTKQKLESYGVKVDMMPEKFSSIGLADLLSRDDVRGKKIIIPRSREAGDFAAKALSELGMEVEEVFLYSARVAEVTQTWKQFADLLSQKRIDAIVFTSASNVRAFLQIMKKMNREMPRDVRSISIGPFTTTELAKMGMTCYEADDHTIKGTVKIVKRLLSQE